MPAFVLRAHKVDEVIDLMYIYVPMGLERESALQGSMLARFCSHELASCFLEVASEQLEMSYNSNACTVTIPENARRHGTREDIVQSWNELIMQRVLRPCYAIELNQITPSDVEE